MAFWAIKGFLFNEMPSCEVGLYVGPLTIWAYLGPCAK